MLTPVAALLLCLTAGCGSKDDNQQAESPRFEVADDPGGESKTAVGEGGVSSEMSIDNNGLSSAPPPISFDELEAIEVPDGTPQELLDFANAQGDKILALQAEPGGRVEGPAKTRAIELFRAIVTASDKLLAHEAATSDERKGAIENKAGAMSWLSQLEPEADWAGQVSAFAGSLLADPDPQVAMRGKEILFGMSLGDFARGRSQDIDGLMTQLSRLLQEQERGGVVMNLAVQAMNTLRSQSYESQALEVLDMIVAAFQDSNDPSLAAGARELVEEKAFVEAEINPKFNAVLSDRPGAVEAFTTQLSELLARPDAGAVTVQKGERYLGMLQQTRHYDVARRVAEMYRDRFAESPNEELKTRTTQLTEMALQRLDLIGQPLVVDAKRLDGVSLDMSHYQGNIVLVMFFAAIDPGCQQELMSVKALYQKYHDQGFDVIGVSVDPNPETLRKFLDQAQLPWVTVTNNEFAASCGVNLVPFGVLLDRSGKVDDIFVQGPELSRRLPEVLKRTPAAQPAGKTSAGPGQEQSYRVPHTRLQTLAAGFAAMEPPVIPLAPAVVTAAAVTPRDADESPENQESTELELDESEEAVNPYLARPGLSPAKLVYFLFDMQEKPKSIQRRPGFAAAVVDAADRILQSDASDKYQLIAIQAKLDVLHKNASLGDTEADAQLAQFVQQLSGDERPDVARQVAFFQLERRVLNADDMQLAAVPDLLGEVCDYLQEQPKLDVRHLRLASATVHAINRLEEDTQREAYFQQFGKLFAKSDHRPLAGYGKKLARGGKGRASDLVGKAIELTGLTDLGVPLDWASYRGKVVLIDFWATWCGPCLRAAPRLRQLYDQQSRDDFDIVAVSLDEDLKELAKYLQEKKVPWTNLVGQDAREMAAKHEVRGIPTFILVDRQGTVVAVGHQLDELRPQLERLVETPRGG
jgi:thiol-disulfide isomerase/thioredoxin